MKRPSNPVLDENFKLDNRKCLICGKSTQGYGAWHNGYTCSRKCEAVKESQPRDFGEHHETLCSAPGDDDGDGDGRGQG